MRIDPRYRSEAGQTTAFVCAMLVTLAMFVALVVNVGQMVNRRVAMQLVADAGAWSGATAQAVQLNHYAYWSRMVQNAYVNASAVSLGFRFSECYSGWAAAGAFYYATSGMARAGLNFANKAYNEARSHSLFNIDDLFPGERNNFDFSTVAGPNEGGVMALGNGNIIPFPLSSGDRLYTGNHEWRNETITQPILEIAARIGSRLPWAKSRAGSGAEQWPCVTILPPTASTVYMYGPAGYKLQKLVIPYLFVWKVSERRATRAFFFDRFFGPNVIPPMTAVAVAKAVGGDMQRGLSRYRAKMIPVGRYSYTQGFIRDTQARPGRILPNPLRRITH